MPAVRIAQGKFVILIKKEKNNSYFTIFVTFSIDLTFDENFSISTQNWRITILAQLITWHEFSYSFLVQNFNRFRVVCPFFEKKKSVKEVHTYKERKVKTDP